MSEVIEIRWPAQVPAGLCRCGCGRPTNLAPQTRTDRGWRKGEPKPFVFGHNPRVVRYTERDTGYGTSCWQWLGTDDGRGYGVLHFRGRRLAAHRWSWEYHRGPIPTGLVIDHLCRNPGCINPEHLEPVTHRENTLRGIGPAAIHARATHCHKGHPFDETTYVDPSGVRYCRVCRRERARRYQARRAAA